MSIQILYVFTFILIIGLLYVWSKYNHLIKQRNRVRTDFADIQVQLNRRASLIQNLVDMVREYAKHENSTFAEVASARSAVSNSKSAIDSANADNMLTQTLRSLMMVTEAYPELRASENFQQLRTDITSTENSLAGYREEYNTTVESYNNDVETFPSLMVASLFGFTSEEYFKPQEAEVMKVEKASRS